MTARMSNEDIVENLTKDLVSSCTLKQNDTSVDESQSVDDVPDHNEKPVSCESENPSEKIKSENINDMEFIDENSLQDRDAVLSDEQKNDFRSEALKYKIDGNEQFKKGSYLDSVLSYSNGLKICPISFTDDRSILYSNRAASKHKLDRKESAIEDCSKAIELNSNYLKAYVRRATLYEETDKLDEALADYKKILEFDPRNKEALAACVRLPNQINERNEKLKAEMMDKLKDLGNMVLKPFGLSTNNFKLTQDSNSGGYSINFVQNP